MKALLLSLVLMVPAYAGAPVDSYKEIKVYPVLCTPTLSSLMSALTIDYAVHVASTFTENPEAFLLQIGRAHV